MITTLTAPHPMAGQKMPTRFRVEQLNGETVIIHDDQFNTGMSVTNNIEEVLDQVLRWADMETMTFYQLGDDGLFKIEWDGRSNPSWIRMGDDDKALRVLYGQV